MHNSLWLAICLGLSACGDSRYPSDSLQATIRRSTNSDSLFYAGTAAYRRQDYAAARQLWQRTLDLKDVAGFGALGYLTYYGLGGPANKVRGRELWREGARRGAVEGHTHLARIVLEGDSAEGGLFEAYAHTVAAEELARTREGPDGVAAQRFARELRDTIAARLPGAILWKADSVGRSWVRVE